MNKQELDKLNRLEKIAGDMGEFLRKYFRMNVLQSKEKYGTVRIYLTFGYTDLHQLIYPGFQFVQKPFQKTPLKQLNWLSGYLLRPFDAFIYEVQEFAYYWVYKQELERNPDLAYNILICAEYPELLLDLFIEYGVEYL